MRTEQKCKICGSSLLTINAHTAKCDKCGVLLYYPYPEDDSSLVSSGEGKNWPRDKVLDWYSKSSFFNHINFTNMVKYAMDESYKGKKLDILDYMGGSGQFALVCKSLFPESNIYITNISDDALLEEWSSLNIQIPFKSFSNDDRKFDFIVLNDVYRHASDTTFVLKRLLGKLKKGGKLLVGSIRLSPQLNEFNAVVDLATK